MLAADTNVLVRFVVADDLAQQRRVRARLERALREGEHVLLTSVVLAEFAWVLDAAYGYARADIARAMRALIDTPPFVSSEKAQVIAALKDYAAGPADFSDYLIVALARAQGAEHVLTFDRKLRRHAACVAP